MKKIISQYPPLDNRLSVMTTKPITPGLILQTYQNFRKSVSLVKQQHSEFPLPQGGFIVDAGTSDSIFVTSDDEVKVTLAKELFLIRPEAVLYLVHLEGVTKNLFLYIFSHILDCQNCFNWSTKEQNDFREWCELINLKVPAEDTLRDAFKTLSARNITLSIGSRKWMINPMIITPAKEPQYKLLMNFVIIGIKRLSDKFGKVNNFVQDHLLPKLPKRERGKALRSPLKNFPKRPEIRKVNALIK